MILHSRSFLPILFICMLFVYVTLCFNVKMSPYKKLTLEDHNLCSPITTRKLELKKSEYQAMFILITGLKTHPVNWKSNFSCKFQIFSSFGGIFAVIQNMKFRRNETTNECIDYINFRDPLNDNSSGRMCGDFNLQEFQAEGQFFANFGGKVITEIFISKEKLEAGKIMDIQIAYTAFSRCAYETSNSCVRDNGYFCIDPIFFNDSIVNCPFDNCLDENGCSIVTRNPDLMRDSGMSTKIILSAVTSLVVSFLVFIGCIWILKKTGRVCWSMHFSDTNRVATAATQPSRVMEMQNLSETEANSAPPPATLAPECDKDPPPSYDSLFPAR